MTLPNIGQLIDDAAFAKGSPLSDEEKAKFYIGLNNWDDRDLQTGRHFRNGHILVTIEGGDWSCQICQLTYLEPEEADRMMCGAAPAVSDSNDLPSFSKVDLRVTDQVTNVERSIGTADVDSNGKVIRTNITDPGWAKMIRGDVGPYSSSS